jgi:monoamine oxidase
MMRNGKLEPADAVFERMRQRLGRLRPPQRDVTFGEFLRRHRRALGATVSNLAQQLVTGFDAADLDHVSARDILKEWSGSSAADAPTFRPVGGYGALMHHFAAGLRTPRCELRLRHVVSAVRWRRGRVDITVATDTGPAQFQARRVIVTVPLSVLQGLSSAAIRFEPALSRKRGALASMAMGPVIKLLLQFREPFWESLHQRRFRQAAFFLASDTAFPTWWTSLPIRNARLVAWAAGPAAVRLQGQGVEALLHAALSSLRTLFGSQVPFRKLLQSFHWHDWEADPFSAGAYSYVRVGGENAHVQLARPILDTLYFAGEACDAEESASVGGALQSGIDVAERIASHTA